MLDFNGVEPAKPNEAIPDGAFAKAIVTIRPGGVDGDGPIKSGLLTASRAEGSDVIQLDCEFTILEGPFARRKFWRKLVLSGSKVDEQGVSIGWKITLGRPGQSAAHRRCHAQAPLCLVDLCGSVERVLA